jgi:hypothetical protein
MLYTLLGCVALLSVAFSGDCSLKLGAEDNFDDYCNTNAEMSSVYDEQCDYPVYYCLFSSPLSAGSYYVRIYDSNDYLLSELMNQEYESDMYDAKISGSFYASELDLYGESVTLRIKLEDSAGNVIKEISFDTNCGSSGGYEDGDGYQDDDGSYGSYETTVESIVGRLSVAESEEDYYSSSEGSYGDGESIDLSSSDESVWFCSAFENVMYGYMAEIHLEGVDSGYQTSGSVHVVDESYEGYSSYFICDEQSYNSFKDDSGIIVTSYIYDKDNSEIDSDSITIYYNVNDYGYGDDDGYMTEPTEEYEETVPEYGDDDGYMPEPTEEYEETPAVTEYKATPEPEESDYGYEEPEEPLDTEYSEESEVTYSEEPEPTVYEPEPTVEEEYETAEEEESEYEHEMEEEDVPFCRAQKGCSKKYCKTQYTQKDCESKNKCEWVIPSKNAHCEERPGYSKSLCADQTSRFDCETYNKCRWVGDKSNNNNHNNNHHNNDNNNDNNNDYENNDNNNNYDNDNHDNDNNNNNDYENEGSNSYKDYGNNDKPKPQKVPSKKGFCRERAGYDRKICYDQNSQYSCESFNKCEWVPRKGSSSSSNDNHHGNYKGMNYGNKPNPQPESSDNHKSNKGFCRERPGYDRTICYEQYNMYDCEDYNKCEWVPEKEKPKPPQHGYCEERPGYDRTICVDQYNREDCEDYNKCRWVPGKGSSSSSEDYNHGKYKGMNNYGNKPEPQPESSDNHKSNKGFCRERPGYDRTICVDQYNKYDCEDYNKCEWVPEKPKPPQTGFCEERPGYDRTICVDQYNRKDCESYNKCRWISGKGSSSETHGNYKGMNNYGSKPKPEPESSDNHKPKKGFCRERPGYDRTICYEQDNMYDCEDYNKCEWVPEKATPKPPQHGYCEERPL